MIYSINCAALSVALEELKKIVSANEERGVKTLVFCEDRLTLAAERTVCAAVGGTFLTSVCTFARFLAAERGKPKIVLSGQGSAMAVHKIIQEHKGELSLFRKLSSASAAQTVYDTIALLYSSRVSAEDTAKAAESGGVLGGKLRDLAIIYSAYENYLEESGFIDRNGYLRQLPSAISSSPSVRGNAVVFLGFQALTAVARECVRAAFGVAADCYGLFIGGKEEIYVNEAGAAFNAIAKEYGGAQATVASGSLTAEAEAFRKGLFNPESFYSPPVRTDKVVLFNAADEEEEMEFVAASIKRLVAEKGVRFAKISVMLPDIDAGERVLSRVFSRFKIPYYADRQRSLSEHPLCSFVANYLSCVIAGCLPEDVDGVISSPFFPAELRDKDLYRNYALKYCNYRGGVKRAIKPEAEDFDAIERVKDTFLQGLSYLTVKGGNSAICGGIRSLFAAFGVENTLKSMAEHYADEKPAAAQFCSRAYESVLAVIAEAESIAAAGTPLKDFLKVIKSGFAAMKISLIPPKSDAVFVGDLTATANTGSSAVFAVRLAGDAAGASADTALLTDREIAALERVNLNISPKIRQVNARKREMCALNLCAFRDSLYLSFPFRLNGEECTPSEIISYATAIFSAPSGASLAPLDARRVQKSLRAIPYYCSEKIPAIRYLRKFSNTSAAGAVYAVLKNNGYENDALRSLKRNVKRAISCGKRLYLSKNGSLSPTALEAYFSCPYLGFMRQGLKVAERDEGAVRAVDTGNFIHAVLQDLAPEINDIADEAALCARAEELARQKLEIQPYKSLADSKSGEYVAQSLVNEAVAVSKGTYAQVRNSSFRVAGAERPAELALSDGVKIYGRIDRVDEYDGLVRVIDYKTGNIDSSPAKYYQGVKLQLPLYLSAAAKGKRAAGAYYFPASLEYRDAVDGVFRLQGFMDGSDEVVRASDLTVQPKEKSGFVDAYYQGRRIESAMSPQDFSDFIEYSRMVADGGAREMLGGNVTPSPAEGVCKYCKAGGSCGAALGKDAAERKVKSVKCSEIARIVRKEKGDETY